MADAIYREQAIGPVNWIGVWTLYEKEVRRFTKVYTQTLLAPVATTLLYLTIFILASGRTGSDYARFIGPGLIMMTMTQNAFANTSSSLVIAKVQGNIVDLLMPPLSPLEVTLAIVLGGMTRGLVVGLVVGLSMIPFVPLSISHPGALIYFAASGSLLFSTLGVLGGIWSEKFDHIAAVTNFVVMPLTFLSGTFYSIDRLPEIGQAVARVDPLFYVVDGFRWGFIDTAETSIGWGVAMLALLNLVLVLATWRCFATGWKLKA